MILSLEKLRKDYKTLRKENPQVGTRLEALIEMTKIELKHEMAPLMVGKRIALSALVVAIKASNRTLERWKALYNQHGSQGLVIKKADGRPAEELPKSIQKIIHNYRESFRWGSETIQAHLLYDHQFETTRFKIDRFIKNSGLLEKYPVTTRKKKVKSERKHTKKVKVEHPGAHTQEDVKYQTHLLGNREKAYVYNFIDHASNWSFKYAYAAINPQNTEDFMKRLIAECPFDIFRLQTDNGVEFTFKYTSVAFDAPKEHPLDTFCNSHGIIHKLVPPGEKELQGLVERSHRQDDQELFSRIDPTHLEEFNKQLKQYWLWRNEHRRFKKLKWKTPNQWLNDYVVRAIVMILMNPPEKGRRPFPRVSSEAPILDIKKKLNEDERTPKGIKELRNVLSIRKLAA
ncbi:MAG: hypothetical protein WCG27_01145 [Pseudomonadota bacterium]